MTSGSMESMNLVNSGQLFLTRRRKLLAFQVKNLVGSFFWVFSSSSSTGGALVSASLAEDGEEEEEEERVGFLKETSFCTGYKRLYVPVAVLPVTRRACILLRLVKMMSPIVAERYLAKDKQSLSHIQDMKIHLRHPIGLCHSQQETSTCYIEKTIQKENTDTTNLKEKEVTPTLFPLLAIPCNCHRLSASPPTPADNRILEYYMPKLKTTSCMVDEVVTELSSNLPVRRWWRRRVEV
ncbi:hypothetical protein Ccrd_015395 [Cynara cardunculus var. scolymus]|uniref:Uncharacterized protein n=1 Tax=Cynara cardunculus var. scolymus TaxID=59895 RepID=A0A103YBW9_CYNCS|nr:hypothetical protein Ccrd_015395 [Cynara cardunculus var. scolymus]